jgi:hypothetical protein
MKNIMILTVATFFTGTTLMAQMKVAQYSFGKPGTDTYEHLEFWTKDGKRSEVNYAYGKDRKEVKLRYLGKGQLNGQTGFKVQFGNNYMLYIIPKRLQLQVTDANGKYNKIFSWEYEGPVNGIGTYCSVCADDDEDAMKLIQSMYLR